MTEPPLRFESRVTWRGSTGWGYDAYDRAHEVRSPPAGAALRVSAAPEFRGSEELWDPEQMLLGAAASCQLLSFLAVAARARLDVIAYDDEATAEMPLDARPVRITKVTLRPRVSLRPGPAPERVRHLVDVAHRECYVASTLACEVVVEPTIVFVDPAGPGAPPG